mmetsp:Transcript_45882/g.120312  ORF Transcript_45882/g.120312 Transcript_45882/m.120312 type:complete len:210 (+) Transcript_45882:99-728(+)
MKLKDRCDRARDGERAPCVCERQSNATTVGVPPKRSTCVAPRQPDNLDTKLGKLHVNVAKNVALRLQQCVRLGILERVKCAANLPIISLPVGFKPKVASEPLAGGSEARELSVQHARLRAIVLHLAGDLQQRQRRLRKLGSLGEVRADRSGSLDLGEWLDVSIEEHCVLGDEIGEAWRTWGGKGIRERLKNVRQSQGLELLWRLGHHVA